MKFKPSSLKFFKLIFLPIVLSGFLLEINFFKKGAFADRDLKPANENDIALYEGMGVSYLCQASRKEIDLDFEKSLGVAAATFVAVIRSKHGSKFIDSTDDKKKEMEVDSKLLFQNASFRILGKAIQLCPDNVPKKSKKEFDRYLKKLQEFAKNK